MLSHFRAKADARKIQRLHNRNQSDDDDESDDDDDDGLGIDTSELPGLLQDLREDQDADQSRDRKIVEAIRKKLQEAVLVSSDEVCVWAVMMHTCVQCCSYRRSTDFLPVVTNLLCWGFPLR